MKDKFIGAWRLVSYTYQKSSGELVDSMGKDVFGLLVYTNSHVTVQISAGSRAKFAENSRLKGTPLEIKPAFESYIAYHGTYDIDEQNGIINHHVAGSLFPNWAGTVLSRAYEFTGNRLALKPPPGKGSETLTWERI